MNGQGRNLTMMTDLYELTMMHGYWKQGMAGERAVFDLFFRRNAPNSAYAIVAGLEQVIEYLNHIRFEADDLAYLRSLGIFEEDFLTLLKDFRFTGDLHAMPEGSLVYPYEPILRIVAPIMEAQLIETALLNLVNHQTLIATKASRVVHAAQGDGVLEFGLRRAQGPDAGIYGARAAIIGGCSATSNVLTGQMFGIPVRGTHAHSWVMSFPTELDAFRAYADIYPENCLLLVDTYDTLRSGVPNAITVFHELKEKGYRPVGIRLDSGDMAYLSTQARRMLDEAGLPEVKIYASGDLDEELIWDLRAQGARIDVWAVGTKLITSETYPALGGVYKLAGQIVDGEVLPRIKISENPAKITNPGLKRVVRILDREGMASADLILLEHETIDPKKPLTIFDPVNTWKQTTYTDYQIREMLVPVFIGGKQVYESPSLMDIQAYCQREMRSLWDQYKRLRNPHLYKVDLSKELYTLRSKMLNPQGTIPPDVPALQPEG